MVTASAGTLLQTLGFS